jgi:hypothetical protein
MFQYGPYHPREGETGDGTGRTVIQRLGDWENAIIQLSQQHPEFHLAVVRGSRLTTPETMVANHWYTSTVDHAHLSIDGYVGIAELGVRQLTSYANIDALQNLSKITSLSFTFDTNVSALLTPDDLILREVYSNTTISPADMAVSWDDPTRTATWTFQGLPLGALPTGKYEATISPSLLSGAAESTTIDAGSIPEPASGAVMLLGLAGLARRRR